VPPTVISADGSYEWDKWKDEENRRKHGVSFEEGASALEFPRVRVAPDGGGKGRLKGVGYSLGGRLLTVVFEEGDPRDRIISARRATPAERRQFVAADKGQPW
jgi:uncharacterized DUF497 family protein